MVVGKRKVTRVGFEPMHRIEPERSALACDRLIHSAKVFFDKFFRKMKAGVILALKRTLDDRFDYCRNNDYPTITDKLIYNNCVI